MQIIDGKLVSFDTTKINLRELILHHFGAESIQEIIDHNINNLIYENLYELQKTTKFEDLFIALLAELSVSLEEDNFYYQTIPSFRIHRSKNKSVNYHNDVMYGHGEKVINAWLPLIDTNKENALCISDIETSKRLMVEINDNKLSISQMNSLIRSNCSPQFVKYGQILLFNTMTMHGTEVNNSNQHRLSFDFRILPYGKSPGLKDIATFYTHNIGLKNQKKEKKKCLFYLFQGDYIGRNFSHRLQREMLNIFANRNNLESAAKEETEISGMDHHPNLFHYLTDERVDNIVMISILCLPRDQETRTTVLSKAIDNKVKLFFCIENSDNQQLTIEQINKYYYQVNDAFSNLEATGNNYYE